MEFELIVAKFLYRHGQISLPGIGIITLKNGAPDADYIAKNRNLPVEGLDFEYKPSAPLQPEFVTYFGEERGKIKSLALSDIESHLQLTRQLLNIGNPYDVQGVGVFTKQNDGTLKLEPGYFINPNQEVVNKGYKLKERDTPAPPKPVQDEESEGGARKIWKPALWILGILALAAAAWFGYNLLKSPDGETAKNATGAADSSATLQQVMPAPTPDSSLANTIDSSVATAATPTVIPGKFKVYIREINGKDEALRRYNKTFKGWENKVYMETSDSSLFKFYVLVDMNASDTASKRDSLDRFYRTPVKFVPLTQ